MSDTTSAKGPLLVCFGLVGLGVIAAVLGHSILGGLVAAGGAIPAAVAVWKGMQQETQSSLAIGLGSVFVAVAVAAVLILNGIFRFLGNA